MSEERWYEDWKVSRGEEPAPTGFVDHVMAGVQATDMRRRSVLTAVLTAMWSSRASRMGVCALAAVACLLRLSHVVAIFLIW